ncbi:MAG: DASH family cryptochrome [Cytophagaceae bacterium]|jgi:deoxyribodipyrimidine photo-lyase|nr:DASH family cryptochrome [Cytophagaceae bacterium]
MKTKALVWFKTDLRIRDNETLLQAIQHHDEVIPVYCLDDRLFSSTQFGFKRIGNYRARFLWESLQDLDQQLRAMGSGLWLLKGLPEMEIPTLAAKLAVQKVYAKKEIAFEEKLLNDSVEQELWKHKITLEVFSTSTLYRAPDMPFSIKEIPDQFTPFRKALESDSFIRSLSPTPSKISSPEIPVFELPALTSFGLEDLATDPRSAMPFQGGERSAWQRLHSFFQDRKLLSSYKEIRNGMLGTDYSTKFSAWLALGCISPKSIYFEIKKFEEEFGSNESTYWLVFELLWRDYFRFMFKKHQHRYFLLKGIRKHARVHDGRDAILIDKWIQGNTGNDFIDANMRELKHTGFMSNRGRQNVASFFCHQYKLDWRVGASYFESQLVDYDVSSNWGNWAYLAGVGNDPMQKRVFNIENQSKEYDPKEEFRKRWLAYSME